MRFLSGGPNIPDELLNARDEGQVIFFCGAGVSMARAGMPSFWSLAQSVIDDLGSAANSPARRLLRAAGNQANVDGVGALIPTDRVFGLLEREFPVREVRASVARTLRPEDAVDLHAHRTLVNLARGPDGNVRLVTTNFDLLFEACDSGLPCSAPPSLPDPRRGREFEGIVHLHGRVTTEYDIDPHDEFVLSSGDFGRAYLSDGWATNFIKTLLNKYQIVFVGYSADDPPIQYLLEALNASSDETTSLYAFQPGGDHEAEALWRHKGVNAISYDPEGHVALWDTLEAWAGRANDVQGWHDAVLSRAMDGPQALTPVERGQVKHIVSTDSGARRFATSAPPAEWLCVFDPRVRFSIATRPSEGQPSFDPFDAFGLDDDPAPPVPDLDNPRLARDIPIDVWDAFEMTKAEMSRSGDLQLTVLHGSRSLGVPRMCPRQSSLGAWISEVADQPTTAWWAAGIGGLHPDIQGMIQRRFERLSPSPVCEQAWSLLFRAWKSRGIDPDVEFLSLESLVRRRGYSYDSVRDWGRIATPRIRVQRPFWSSPPSTDDLEAILKAEVEFPHDDVRENVPNEFLALLAAEQRRCLEIGIELELETVGYEGLTMPPLERESSTDDFSYGYEIAATFFAFAHTLDRLLTYDAAKWQKEIQSWRSDGALFSRLRIWAAGKIGGFAAATAAEMFLFVGDEAFWALGSQRDLLIALARRWNDVPTRLRRRLERRLLNGPTGMSESYGRSAVPIRRAQAILTRLWWLSAEGCVFSFDVAGKIESLRAVAPKWRDEYGRGAVRSMATSGGFISTDSSTRGLETVPPTRLLEAARSLGGRDFDSLSERAFLQGMVSEYPLRLLRGLVLQSRLGEYPLETWETFLLSEARQTDVPRLRRQIARRIARLPVAILASLAYPVSEWILRVAEPLQSDDGPEFAALWTLIIETLRQHPKATHSALLRQQGIDWAGHSLNSPVGKLAQTLMKDEARLPTEAGFPVAWLARGDDLLTLPGDARRDAIVIFSHQVNWLYFYGREWTEDRILGILHHPNVEDIRAFWAGFFWSGQIPTQKLFERLKSALLGLVKSAVDRSTHAENLAHLILAGWVKDDEAEHDALVSNSEMRAALIEGGDSFRSHTIWNLEHWWKNPEEDFTGRTLEFLHEVWPKQLSARSDRTSERLVVLALSRGDRFSEMVDAVLPLLSHLPPQSLVFYRLKDRVGGEHSDLDPFSLLKLLSTVLPEHVADWPYRADEIVAELAALPALVHEERMVKLRLRLAMH